MVSMLSTCHHSCVTIVVIVLAYKAQQKLDVYMTLYLHALCPQCVSWHMSYAVSVDYVSTPDMNRNRSVGI